MVSLERRTQLLSGFKISYAKMTCLDIKSKEGISKWKKFENSHPKTLVHTLSLLHLSPFFSLTPLSLPHLSLSLPFSSTPPSLSLLSLFCASFFSASLFSLSLSLSPFPSLLHLPPPPPSASLFIQLCMALQLKRKCFFFLNCHRSKGIC